MGAVYGASGAARPVAGHIRSNRARLLAMLLALLFLPRLALAIEYNCHFVQVCRDDGTGCSLSGRREVVFSKSIAAIEEQDGETRIFNQNADDGTFFFVQKTVGRFKALTMPTPKVAKLVEVTKTSETTARAEVFHGSCRRSH